MTLQYGNGEEVRLGDIVDIGHGNGPTLRVAVIPQLGLAAPGFDVHDWPTLADGVLLQDVKTGGLVSYSEFYSDEPILIKRAS